ncbi:MAG: hypothetical protein R3F42_15565 [Pseudomonadota bacterium]
MILINGFLHRERLYQVIRRWLHDDLQAGDVDEILRLVHFNNVYVSRYLERFSARLLQGLHGAALHTETVTTKGALRDRISRDLPRDCARCVALGAAYAHNPGQYYRETPFHGRLYFRSRSGSMQYLGSSRVKRIRRLAEKCARRVVDWLHEAGGAAGLPGAPALTPAEQQQAEQLVLLRVHDFQPAPGALVVNDVAGVKLVLEARHFTQLLDLLQAGGDRVIEQERHDGIYRATHIVVEHHPDRAAILAEPLHDGMLRVFAAHGYSSARADAAFREFVCAGEAGVNVEIIVTGYLEMLEGEIGRCMHEDRIIRQRHNPRYYGQLAQNVGFLLEFLFTYPALPYRTLERLPLRIRDRYLPDYFDEVRRRLFNNPSVELHEL